MTPSRLESGATKGAAAAQAWAAYLQTHMGTAASATFFPNVQTHRGWGFFTTSSAVMACFIANTLPYNGKKDNKPKKKKNPSIERTHKPHAVQLAFHSSPPSLVAQR